MRYLFYSPAQFNEYSQAGFQREGDDFLILPSSAELSVLQSCIDRLSAGVLMGVTRGGGMASNRTAVSHREMGRVKCTPAQLSAR